jgi:tRNA pseudouridine38-40 synthase
LADQDIKLGGQVRRIALRIEYDGSGFHGWQTQVRHRTVQQELADALAGLVGHPVNLIGCSRTDTGVHALEHVSHFVTTGTIPTERLPFALNSRLPSDLTVHEATDVGDSFHARYGAIAKSYRYLVHQARTPSALLAGRAAFLPLPLDLPAMQASAILLTGEHDFSAFMDTGSKKQKTVRRIDSLSVRQDGNLIIFDVRGNGFLYHMVRIIVGTLIAAGQGRFSAAVMTELIHGRDRRQTGKTMPACGLYLTRVDYEPAVFSHDAATGTQWPTGEFFHV